MSLKLKLLTRPSTPNNRSFGRNRVNILNSLIKLQNPNSNVVDFFDSVETQADRNEKQKQIYKRINEYYLPNNTNEDDQDILAAKDNFEAYREQLILIDTKTFTEFSNVYTDIINNIINQFSPGVDRANIDTKLNKIKELANSLGDENEEDVHKRLTIIKQNQNIKLQIAINAIEILQELTGDYTNETAFEFLIILKRHTDKILTELGGGKRASAKPRYSRRRSIRSKPTRRYGRRPSRKSASRRRKVLRRVSRKR